MELGKKDELSENLFLVNSIQQVYIHTQLKTMGLNIQQSRALNYISEHSGTIQKELVNYLGKQKATVTNVLKALEERNLIVRRVPEHNERQKQLFLTAEGAAAVQQVQQIFVDIEGKINAGLTKEEHTQLLNLLQKVKATLSTDED
ncbi:MarR family winged helix-turn-helix transcriptional regulator [Lacticaseibacillus zhaodongensis]|uniref:MarR family winged helix-turn-helix transcriptional regulator n=1 Tax=Lacticaseibacillus zhaodongensis TaxID=2668065 RepID=UPI001E6406AF|nr:MarR family transcriptional regulator [Lacticaseibacillus zhaodongensis]